MRHDSMSRAEIERIKRFAKKISESLWRKNGVGRAAVMIGAGFSMNAVSIGGSNQKMLSWNGLAQRMREELGLDNNYQPNATDLAELYEAEYGRQKLEQFLEINLPDESMEPGELHEILLELPWADVFTTNYDTLLERTAEKISLYQYQPVLSQEDIPEVPQPRIVKLHGTFRKKRPLIFTSTDYQEYLIKSAAFVNMVQETIMENTFCLFGFSGDDPNFRKWMSWVQQNLHDYHTNIYLCGVLHLSAGQRKLLEKLGIVPIDLAPLIDENHMLENPHGEALRQFLQMLKENEPRNIIDNVKDIILDKNRSICELGKYIDYWVTLPDSIKDVLRIRLKDAKLEHFLQKTENREKVTKICGLLRCYELDEYILNDEEFNSVTKWVLKYKNSKSLWWCEAALFLQAQANYQNKAEQFADWTTILEKHVKETPKYKVRWLYQQCLWAEKNWQLYKLGDLLQLWPEDGVTSYWQIKKAHFLSFLGDFHNAYQTVENTLHSLHKALHRNPGDNFLISQEAWALYFQQMLYRTCQILSISSENTNYNYAQSRWAEHRQEGNDPRVYIDFVNEKLKQDVPRFYSETIGYDINTIQVNWSFSSGTNFVTYSQLSYFLATIGIPLRIGMTSLFDKSIEKYTKAIAPYIGPLEITQLFLLTEDDKAAKWYFSRLRVSTFTEAEAQSVIVLVLSAFEELLKYPYFAQSRWQQSSRLKLMAEILSRLCLRMMDKQKEDFHKLLKRWKDLTEDKFLRDAEYRSFMNRLLISKNGLPVDHVDENKLKVQEAKKKIQEEAFITPEKYKKNLLFSEEMEREICDYINLCRTYIRDPFNYVVEGKFVTWSKKDAKRLAEKFIIYLEKALVNNAFSGHCNFHLVNALSVFNWDVLSVLNVKDTTKVIQQVQNIFSKNNQTCLQILPFLLKTASNNDLLEDITLKLIQGFWGNDQQTVQDVNRAIENWIVAYHEKIIAVPCQEKLWQELLRKVEAHSDPALFGSITALSEIIQYVPEQLNKENFTWLMYGMESLFVNTELHKDLLLMSTDYSMGGNRDWVLYQSCSARLAETLYKWTKKYNDIDMPDILLKWRKRCQESFLPEVRVC